MHDSPGQRGIEVATIYVIDDDLQACNSVSVFAQSIGHHAESFSSVEALLKECGNEIGEHSDDDCCIVTEVQLSGMDVHDLLREMSQRPNPVPVIVLTAHATTALIVQVIKSGAITVLEKPFQGDKLRAAILETIGQNESQRTRWDKQQRVSERIESLTDKERAVMDLMFEGLANKVIANRLGCSVRTIESRRSVVLEKMGVGSLAQLVRMIAESEQ